MEENKKVVTLTVTCDKDMADNVKYSLGRVRGVISVKEND